MSVLSHSQPHLKIGTKYKPIRSFRNVVIAPIFAMVDV